MYRLIEDNKYMKIKSSYSLGGMNYFSGKNEERGLRVHFSVVEKNGYSERSTPRDDTNFKFLIKKMKRASQKQSKKLNEWLLDNQDELFDEYGYYINKEPNDIRRILSECIEYML